MDSKNQVVQRKICLLGDFAIGKTSLVRRFVFNLFDERYLTTIGVNITKKEVVLGPNRIMNFVIWDLASSDIYENLRSHYLHGIAGALLVCDLTRPETIEKLRTTYLDQLYRNSAKAFIIVVGNKIDLVKPDAESITMVKALAEELSTPCQFTSAKTGDNVENTFRLLATELQK